ncbi:MAG: DUF2341 domain-containing protein [Chitinophagales bacterium]|nr:DUF2341 domain-containing protein [Chitinophagales bacterium]
MKSTLLSRYLQALAIAICLFTASSLSAQTTFYSETFTESNGTTSGTNWYRDVSACSFGSNRYFQVQSNRMEGRGTNCNAVWYSVPIDISNYSTISLSAALSESGSLESDDYIRIRYQIDGGPWNNFSTNGNLYDDFTSATASQNNLSGRILVLSFIANNDATDEYYRVDNITATGTLKNNFSLGTSVVNASCISAGSIDLTVIPGTVGGSIASPYNTSSCSVTLTGSSSYTLNAGQTGCVTGSFTGNLTMNGGTLVNAGSASISSLNFNTGEIINNGSMSISNLSLNGNTFRNYGTLSVSGTISINNTSTLYNHGSLTAGTVDVNSSAALYNTNEITVSSFINNNITLNSGSIEVSGTFTNNSSTTFTNNGSLSANAIQHNGLINNYGSISTTSLTTINSSGTITMNPGANLSTGSITLNGTINNTGSACANVSVSGSTTINSSGSMSGNVQLCDANGVETNWSSNYSGGAALNCNCSGLGYTYLWSNGATTQDISGLAAGTYTVTVTGPNGTTASTSVTVTSSGAAPSITLSKTDETASGASNGAVTLSRSGGTSPFTYSWNNGATTQNLSNIPGGSYSVTVTDAIGCTGTAAITVNTTCVGGGFSYYRTITIDHNDVFGSADLADFPFLIDITDNTLRMVANGGRMQNSNGYDVTFTNSAGTQQLSFEIESYTATTGRLVAWVRIPTLFATTNTVIRLYYGKSGITINPSTSLTWANDYKGVWHLHNSSFLDASYNNNDGSNNGSTDFSSGKIAGSRSFDGNDHVAVSYSSSLALGDELTVSAWFRESSRSGGHASIVAKNYSNDWRDHFNMNLNNGTPTLNTGCDASGGTISTSTWNHIVATGTPTNRSIYVNGILVDAESCGSSFLTDNNPIGLGAQMNGGSWSEYFNGQIDEARVQDVARSADWIRTEYTNQNNPSTTYTVGSETSNAISLTTTSGNACNGQNDGDVNITAVGGTSPYTFAWSGMSRSGGGTSATNQYNITGVPAGSYSITVTDACGTTGTASASVSQYSAINPSVSATNVSCNGGSNGAVTLTVTGGTSPYTYNWGGGITTQNRTSLAAGTYTVTITDNNGCSATASATITQPTALSASISGTNPTCAGGTGAANLTVSGGTSPYTYNWGGGITTEDRSNLSAGTYTVTVTDSRSCTTTASVTLTLSGAITASVSGTNTICSGASSTFTASGGTSYVWSTGATTAAITVSTAGTYSVTATASGCTASSSRTLTVNAAPTAAISGTQTICSGGSSTFTASGGGTYLWSTGATTAAISVSTAGTYTVTVTGSNGCTATASRALTVNSATASISGTQTVCAGGTTTFTATGGGTYLWSTGATTAAITVSSSGTYNVTVTNSGCTASASRTANISSTISPSIAGTNVNCFGQSTGAATLTVTGGTSPYTYNWGGGVTTQNRTGLVAGTYTVTVTDANACTATASVTITQPSAALSASIAGTNVNCFGQSTGAANLTVTGGTSPYTYNWGGGITTQNRTGLAAGTYTVTVTDSRSCTTTASVTITQPSAALSASIAGTNVNCFGQSTGAATLTVTGGTSPYTYNWGGGVTTQNRTGLAAGTYTVTVTDANSCTITASTTITQPTALSVTTTPTNVTCGFCTDGTITTSVSGGVSPYTYNWGSGVTSQNRSNLAPNTYTVTVTDANGCTVGSSALVGYPMRVNIAGGSACSPGAGSATASTTGGVSPYSYVWSTGATTATISNLNSGTYYVTATDSRGTTATQSVIISNTSFTGALTPASANICQGQSVQLTATGGNVFTWSPSTGLSNATIANPVASPTVSTTYTVSTGITSGELVTNGDFESGNTGFTSAYGYVSLPSGNLYPEGLYAVGTSAGSYHGNFTGLGYGGTGNFMIINGATVQGQDVWTQVVSVTPNTDYNFSTWITSVNEANPAQLRFEINGTIIGPVITAPNGVRGTWIQFNTTWNSGSNTSATISIVNNNTVAGGNDYGLDNISFTTVCTYNGGNIPITVRPTPTVNAGTDKSVCQGSSTTLTASATGSGITYAWSSGASTASTSVSPSSTTNYVITVTNSSSCSASDTVAVVVNTRPTVSLSGTNIGCFGASTGAITTTVTNGTAPYSYNWGGGVITQNRTGLAAGTYNVTVTDANGCTGTASITLTQPSALSASIAGTNVSCNGGTNGAATLTVSGGTSPFTYNWGGGITTQNRTALAAGTYTVTVTDANSCTVAASVTITQPSILSGSITATNVACFGNSTGTATLTVTGGTSAYTYNWGGGVTTQNRTALAAGTYTVTITDSRSCTATASVTISQPSAALTASIAGTNVACRGNSTGAATLTVSGGTSPYTYNWGGGVTTQNRTGLAAGTYTVTVTDANACTTTASVTITQPAAALSASIAGTNVSCNGGTNGAATLTASGGTSPYTYNWGGGVTTQNRTALTAGTYTVTVTDANACTATAAVTITQPAVVSGTISVTNVACFGNSTGAATLTPAGGTAPYTYNWGGGITTQNRTGLAAGTYTVTITDSRSCTATASVTITQPSAALSASITGTNVACRGNSTGAATLTVSGGTSPYSFNWGGGVTTQNRTGLAAGTYTVTVTDANACTTTASVTITQPAAALSASIAGTNVSCNGGTNGAATLTASGGTSPYAYNWGGGITTQNRTGLAAGTYTVTVTDANACTATASVTITQPSALSIGYTRTHVTCNGAANGTINLSVVNGTSPYTYLWNSGATTANRTGLAPGNHSVTVTDANGCTASNTINITQPVAALSAQVLGNNLSCYQDNSGMAYLNSATGGTGPYVYTWSNGSSSSAIYDLAAGTYTLTVTDAQGCSISKSVTLTEPTAFTISASATDVSCNGSANGSVNLTASSSYPPYTYTWSSGEITEDLSGKGPGTYSVEVMDANGCTATASATITQPSTLTASIAGTNVNCNGGTNGAADLTVSGGTSPYSYNWGGGITSDDRTSLAAGTYTVTVLDANNCSATASTTLTQPTAMSVSLSGTNINCNGGATGAITTTVTGGTSPYTYNWGGGVTTQNRSGITAGTYTVTVSDSRSCTATASITITQATALTVAVTGTNITCNGASTGSVTMMPSGGTPSYTYLWNTGNTSQNLTSRAAGTYSVTVTDSRGCTGNGSVTLTQPTAISAIPTATNATCNGGSNGSISLAVTGGTSPYTYNWGSGITTQNRTGLSAGTYTVTITDANACTATASSSVGQGTSINLSTSTTAQTKANLSDGSVSLTVSGGTSPYTYNWGGGVTTQNRSNVVAGTYTVTVTDAAGCTASTSATVTIGPCICVATGNWSNGSTWLGDCHGGGGKYAGAPDDVVIQGYKVTVDSTHAAKSVRLLESTSDTTRLTFTNSNTLAVTDSFVFNTSATGKNVEVKLEDNAELNVSGDMSIIHSGGKDIWVYLNQNSGNNAKLAVGGDLDITLNNTANDLVLKAFAANDSIVIGGDLNLYNNSSNSGKTLDVVLNSTARMIVAGNINLNAVRDGNLEITLNSNSTLELKGNLNRVSVGGAKFGSFTSNGNANLLLNGSSQQVLPGNTGSGNDAFTYKDVIINNTSSYPQIVTNGTVTITDSLIFMQGMILTNNDSIIFTNTASGALRGHSANSYIVGTLRRYIASNTATYDFPIGRGGTNGYFWARIKNNLMIGPSYLTAEFKEVPQSEVGRPINVVTNLNTFTELNTTGMWSIEPNVQPLLGSYDISVSTENFTGLYDNMFGLIKRPRSSGTQSWGIGNGLIPLWATLDRLVSTGSTSLSTLGSFSDFGIGQNGGGGLPIELLSFDGEYQPEKNAVRLYWNTEVEVNNDYFIIQRSEDGVEYTDISRVPGAGNSTLPLSYETFDNDPLRGTTYYRLVQYDFDGKFAMFDPIAITVVDRTADHFKVYPVPSTGVLNLELKSKAHDISVIVYDMNGSIIQTFGFNNELEVFKGKIDLTGKVASGQYFIRIMADGEEMVKKVTMIQ